ncbi:MAG: hypothetical protein E6H10_13070 [Bacteroidetes bacterium]|nr:MAG: hypothetical protein E6H10_13070 [Bacteroidota bacterium]
MKAIHAFFSLVMVTKFCYCQEQADLDEVAKDNPIFKIAKTYFRSNPFNIHFSTFLSHLTSDPALSNKTINKRTDTSFFFFRGEYKGHNPYTFKADKVEIRLAEGEVTMEDSVSTIDTLLFYQLVGYSYEAAGTEAVKKEFSKFDRKFGQHFYAEDSVLKKDNEPIGMVKNYFLFSETFLSPVSIGWVKLDDLQNVFTITFRIKLTQNMATLPQFPDGH